MKAGITQAMALLIAALLLLVATAPAGGQCPGGRCPGGQCLPDRGPSGGYGPLGGYQTPHYQTRGAAPQAGTRVPSGVTAAIVKVQNWVGPQHRFEGAGTLVAKGNGRALIVTCAHTFYDTDKTAGQAVVVFPSGRAYGANILGHDASLDALLLEIAEPAEQPIALAANTPQRGDAVYAIGYGGAEGTMQCSPGAAVDYRTRIGSDGRAGPAGANFVISGSATPGDSGGPMLDAHWQVCGVLYGTNGRGAVDGVALPRLRAFIQRWAARIEFRREQAPILGRRGGGGAPPAPTTPEKTPAQTAPNADAERQQFDAERQRLRAEIAALEARLKSQPTAAPPNTEPAGGEFDRQTPPAPRLPEWAERLPGWADGAGKAVLKKGLLAVGLGAPAAALGAGVVWWIVKRRARKRLATLVGAERTASGRLRVARVNVVDHEYERLLDALRREAEYDPKTSAPVVERVLSIYDQLSGGAERVEKMRTAEGATLGWKDQPKGS
jgi:hypothetical protein